jgi:hypothetical protein
MRIAGSPDALPAITSAWREQYGGPADGPGQVGEAHLVATPGQVGRDQIPGCAPHQRAMNEQQPGTHALFVSTPATPTRPPPHGSNARSGLQTRPAEQPTEYRSVDTACQVLGSANYRT